MRTDRPSSPPHRRRLRRLLLTALASLALVPATVLTAASPAQADTSDFRGVNWAVLGDNFSTGPLVIDGLSASDSYATVQAKANAVYDDMESLLGVNTVRLPINTHTVGTAWWNAYRGAIDAATARGFKVILAYWEDGAASGGRITNMAAFNTMWSTVTYQYGSNGQVYFEPMNEPHGYSSAEWRDVAADWLEYHYSAPPERVLIGGTGYSQDLRPICDDSRFDGTLLSFHHYAFFYGEMDYAAWRSHVQTRLGDCADRAVVTEFGAPMDNGLNYSDAGSANNFVRHIRAVTDVMRANGMGGTYWPALGGKPGSIGYDWYSMFAKSGSGANLNLTLRNDSGADRLRYGWGDDVDGGGEVTTVDIVNRNSGRCVDVVGGSTADGAEIIQYDCHGGANQQWELQDAGGGYYRIVSSASGRCLDVDAASTADGARAIQWACNGGTNQQWQLRAAGNHTELVARHSGKCLGVVGASTANSARLQQFTCSGAASQQWTL
ncbi:RICIN domain-containing protein [Glycomyces sp. A-F 0318]|uniref:ricin-type beta-trefoil lectin domain protein n=1 Tax=Glycomyces amatae TaxID=2881355 RepID=UPI001E308587|nr:ricin-type beta-trefoil lectin domain protein [Glycomyces amatae]MCD0447229.1 RICIN domain-containing protein [Glycomyces amatae]